MVFRIAGGFCLFLSLLVGCGQKPTYQEPAGGDTAGGGAAVSEGGGRASVIGYTFPVTAGKYTVLDILTDNKSSDQSKSNAEDTITKHPNVACMVGLWAYNPPTILQAVEAAGKVGQIKIVGFDEQGETLQGIAEGKIVGTIVQQPFLFGYKSVEYMAALARGQQVQVPETKMIYIDHTIVTADNVNEFRVTIENIRQGKGTPPPSDRDDYTLAPRVKVSFLTNSVDPFWDLAEQGCILAAQQFQVDCKVEQPTNGTVEEQKVFLETIITEKYQGLAISPIDPANQGEDINRVCDLMPVIAQDSDAPQTRRRFYIGTSNYLAGRAAGKLVKESCPSGGQVMILVGKMEVLNAQERSKGLIDELAGKPLPPEFAADE